MQETTKKTEQKPVVPTLKKLEVGAYTLFPLNRMNYVCKAASCLQLECGYTYSCKRDRENGMLIVTRTL